MANRQAVRTRPKRNEADDVPAWRRIALASGCGLGWIRRKENLAYAGREYCDHQWAVPQPERAFWEDCLLPKLVCSDDNRTFFLRRDDPSDRISGGSFRRLTQLQSTRGPSSQPCQLLQERGSPGRTHLEMSGLHIACTHRERGELR